MKPLQIPCSISNQIPLEENVIDFLNNRYQNENGIVRENNIQGSILCDTRYIWLSNGPRLEVLHRKSGAKIAAWTFGAILRDFQTTVTCVTDLPGLNGKSPLLAVGLDCQLTGGMICFFDISSSKVLRAIQIDEKVTSVHVVNVGCDSSLPGALRALDGVLAVGTVGGKILLIDLCRQVCEEAIACNGSDFIRDELNTCQLIHLTFHDLNNLERHKEVALKTGDHLCLQLNEYCTSGPHFILQGPKGDERLLVAKEEVSVSSLHYCPQLGALLIGYNFGAFQLYNLLAIRLEYTSPVYEDYMPVSHFAVQEPCDDPKAFCYIWVMYSGFSRGEAGFPIAVMYAFAYNTKDFLEGYGYLYQDLVSCSVRFQVDLTALPGSRVKKAAGARCISLRTYNKGIINKQSTSFQDIHEEYLALCVVVWTVWDITKTTETYMCLFDLNQWYKEQMPNAPRPDDTGSYMVHVSFTDVFRSTTDSESLVLDTRLDPSSINQFICAQRLEEHYFPSALAFKCICIRQKDIISLSSPGVQRQLLSRIDKAGPLCMLRPSDIFHQCIALGLIPLYNETTYNINTPLNDQREMILSVALEQQLVSWLCQCAREWCNGSQASAGCTLDFLLNWAWQRGNILKANANKLCVPLFDYSGQRLDANAHILLNHCACQLRHLTTLFGTVVNSCTTFLFKEDIEDIEYQWKALQMISVYFEVLQWLLNVGLLPECPLSMYPRPDEAERISAPYPSESLNRFYQCRRTDLQTFKNHKSTETPPNGCNLLFIDNLINLECGGPKLRMQWECDGGSGLYPPPSLQALLRTYLIEDVDIVHKHCLFIYLFLDLAMTLDQSRYKPIITHLIKFPAVFKLSPSIIKITQAFWQLDHGDFATSMAQLLDPLVDNKDLKPWHHRTMMKALLVQEQHQHALLYYQVRKPPISDDKDLKIIITLLVINDMVYEAFQFQQQNKTKGNEMELLYHFFEVCDKTDQLVPVLYLPLSSFEEKMLMKYLEDHRNGHNENFMVIYYLQRSRYAEAFDCSDMLNANHVKKQGLVGQKEAIFRDLLISGYKKTLPKVTLKLLEHCQKEKQKNWINVERPVPMSVFIHDSKEQAKYKSTLIQASFQKARETWMHLDETEINSEETPFISTPRSVCYNKTVTTPIIYPKIVYPMDAAKIVEELGGPTPAKRMKLSSRQPASARLVDAERPGNMDRIRRRFSLGDSLSLLDTPIVKRKSYRTEAPSKNNILEEFNICTPPSILKVRSLLRKSPSPNTSELRDTSVTPENLDDVDMTSNSGVQPLDKITAEIIKSASVHMNALPQRKSFLGISPRRPIQRTPRPGVRFDDRKSTPTDTNVQEMVEIQINITRETAEKEANESNINSNNSSKSTEDTFYSPNSSFSKSNETSQTAEALETTTKEAKEIQILLQPEFTQPQNILNDSQDNTPEKRASLKRKASDSTVKSRRSYKANVTFSTPESSVREEKPDSQTFAEQVLKKDILPKLGGRRSLSRQVLEQNMLSKALASSKTQTRLPVSRLKTPHASNLQTTGLEMSYSETKTSIVKETSNNVTKESCDKSVSESKNVFTTEKDPNTLEHVLKHVHNESFTKSKVKKVIEVLETPEKETDSIHQNVLYNILRSGSDVDDSFIGKYARRDNLRIKSLFSSFSDDSDELDESRQKPEKSDESNKHENAINQKNISVEDLMEVDEIMEVNKHSEDETVKISQTSNDKNPEVTEEKLTGAQQNILEDISLVVDEEKQSDRSENEEKISNQSEDEDNPENLELEVFQKNLRASDENSDVDEDGQREESDSEEKLSNQDYEEEIIEDEEINEAEIITNDDHIDEEDLVAQEEEEVEEEVEEEYENEETEEEDVSDEDSERVYDDESSSSEECEDNVSERSSRSSDVIEVFSSSEESLEELKLDQSVDIESPEYECLEQEKTMELNVLEQEIAIEVNVLEQEVTNEELNQVEIRTENSAEMNVEQNIVTKQKLDETDHVTKDITASTNKADRNTSDLAETQDNVAHVSKKNEGHVSVQIEESDLKEIEKNISKENEKHDATENEENISNKTERVDVARIPKVSVVQEEVVNQANVTANVLQKLQDAPDNISETKVALAVNKEVETVEENVLSNQKAEKIEKDTELEAVSVDVQISEVKDSEEKVTEANVLSNQKAEKIEKDTQLEAVSMDVQISEVKDSEANVLSNQKAERIEKDTQLEAVSMDVQISEVKDSEAKVTEAKVTEANVLSNKKAEKIEKDTQLEALSVSEVKDSAAKVMEGNVIDDQVNNKERDSKIGIEKDPRISDNMQEKIINQFSETNIEQTVGLQQNMEEESNILETNIQDVSNILEKNITKDESTILEENSTQNESNILEKNNIEEETFVANKSQINDKVITSTNLEIGTNKMVAETTKDGIPEDCLDKTYLTQPEKNDDLCRTDILSKDLLKYMEEKDKSEDEVMETQSHDSKNSDASTIPYVPNGEEKVEIIESQTKRKSRSKSPSNKPERSSSRMSTRSTSSQRAEKEESFKPERSKIVKVLIEPIIETLSENKSESPHSPLRRSLRKKSVSEDVITKSDEVEQIKGRSLRDKSKEKDSESIPKRSTRASSVVRLSTEEDIQTGRKRRAASVDIESRNSNDSKESFEEVKKRLRSNRGIAVEMNSPGRESTTSRKSKRKNLVTEVIPEEPESEENKYADAISGKIEEYAATHRLTRSQKMIMEKSMELQERKMKQDREMESKMGHGLEVAHIDPIKLLDKESFSGEPDLEERYHRSSSPASSVDTQSSVGTRSSMRLRAKQALYSPVSDTEMPSTPKRTRRRQSTASPDKRSESGSSVKMSPELVKLRRRSFTLAQQAFASPTSSKKISRSNSQDTDISDASIVSSPVVQLERILRPEDSNVRHRSLSPTLLKQADVALASPLRATRKSNRKSVLPLHTDLSKITEESIASSSNASESKSNEITETKSSRRRGSKRSTQRQDVAEEKDVGEKGITASKRSKRSSSVLQSLQDFYPKHLVMKARTSYKITNPSK